MLLKIKIFRYNRGTISKLYIFQDDKCIDIATYWCVHCLPAEQDVGSHLTLALDNDWSSTSKLILVLQWSVDAFRHLKQWQIDNRFRPAMESKICLCGVALVPQEEGTAIEHSRS